MIIAHLFCRLKLTLIQASFSFFLFLGIWFYLLLLWIFEFSNELLFLLFSLRLVERWPRWSVDESEFLFLRVDLVGFVLYLLELGGWIARWAVDKGEYLLFSDCIAFILSACRRLSLQVLHFALSCLLNSVCWTELLMNWSNWLRSIQGAIIRTKAACSIKMLLFLRLNKRDHWLDVLVLHGLGGESWSMHLDRHEKPIFHHEHAAFILWWKNLRLYGCWGLLNVDRVIVVGELGSLVWRHCHSRELTILRRQAVVRWTGTIVPACNHKSSSILFAAD